MFGEKQDQSHVLDNFNFLDPLRFRWNEIDQVDIVCFQPETGARFARRIFFNLWLEPPAKNKKNKCFRRCAVVRKASNESCSLYVQYTWRRPIDLNQRLLISGTTIFVKSIFVDYINIIYLKFKK